MSEKSSSPTLLQTFLLGLLALLPLTLTVIAIVWSASLVEQFVGPNSMIGGFLVDLGLSFVDSKVVAYVAGILLVLLVIFTLGLLLQRRLARQALRIINNLFRRIPVVGKIYELADRFISVFGISDDPKMTSMTPAWCFFGGDGGTAVLALLPSSEPIEIDGYEYLAILVPSAPVPVGGGLLFVRKDWVKPANVGMEGLTSIYVTMGVSAPAMLQGKTEKDA
ncbi:MAG: DUF502 domain-containing protein [Hyphomicrobiaceae bacterium]